MSAQSGTFFTRRRVLFLFIYSAGTDAFVPFGFVARCPFAASGPGALFLTGAQQMYVHTVRHYARVSCELRAIALVFAIMQDPGSNKCSSRARNERIPCGRMSESDVSRHVAHPASGTPWIMTLPTRTGGCFYI